VTVLARVHIPSFGGANEWLNSEPLGPAELQGRLAGRTDMEIASLADLLHETSERHGAFEAVAPPHDWWDWYAAYMDARQAGSSPDEASAAAGRYMAEAKGIVVARTFEIILLAPRAEAYSFTFG
jgi:hypothetical protein